MFREVCRELDGTDYYLWNNRQLERIMEDCDYRFERLILNNE